MNKIQTGANIAIDKTDSIDVIVSWLPQDLAIDACAFVLSGTEKVRSNDDFIYHNRLSHKEGFIRLATAAGKQVFHVDLAKIPQGVEKIVFAVAAENTLNQLFDLNITIDNLVSFSPTLESIQSLILGELYCRNQQWKFRAVGQGYAQGFTFLENRYGVHLENEAAQTFIPASTNNRLSNQVAKVEANTSQQHTTPPTHRTIRGMIASNIKLIQSLSILWILYSLVVFIVVELFLAGFVGQVVVGRFVPHTLTYLIEVILIISSFFIGGAIVGIISPKIRILEPAIAAFLCVLLTLSISFFSPYRFMAFTWTKVAIGGGTAFFLAWFGAFLGEKFSARMGNKDSREYFGDDL